MIKETEYTIYRITSPTNRVYIGQTKNFDLRMKDYKYLTCKSQHLLYQSLNKYTFNKHSIEILYTGLDKNEANKKEIELIAIYKSKNKSLNIREGGSIFGNINFVKIHQFDLYGNHIKSFNSTNEASKYSGITKSALGHCLKKGNYRSGDYLWCNDEEFKSGFKPTKEISYTRKKEVFKFNLKGELICEYKSISEASRRTGIATNVLDLYLKKNTINSSGYVFSYTIDGFIEPKSAFKNVLIINHKENTETIIGCSKMTSKYLGIGYSATRARIQSGNIINGIQLKYI